MKLRLTPGILKLAYKFIDVESLGESSVLDGRTIEYGFAISKLARLPVGRLLDVGCVARVNPVISTMCELGWKVDGIDIRDYKYFHPNFTFIRGDITSLDTPISYSFYDAVTAISTLEHIGIKGRYGIDKEDNRASLKAIANTGRILKLGGTFIVTLPISKIPKETILSRNYSTYGATRLFDNWDIKDIRFQDSLGLFELVKGKE